MITNEQRIARRAGLGGSDIAGIIPCADNKTGTLSPWTTAVQVWDSKVGPVDAERKETEAMWWGNYDEDGVARRFTEMTGKKVVNHNFMIKDGCLLANLDRLIVPAGQKIAAYHGEIRTDELFEAKTSGEDWPMSDVVEVTPSGFEILDGATGIPVHYITQCNHYLGRVPGAKRIYVGVKLTIPCGWFARTDFRVYRLDRDDEAIAAQDEYARAWWERHVVGGVRPDPVCESDVKILWRRSVPETSIVVTAPLFDAWKRLRLAKDTLEVAKNAEAEAKAEIQKAMADNEAVVAPDGKTVLATWKSGKDKTVSTTDWEALARDKGVTDEEIAARTTTVVKPGTRTFLPKFTDKVIKVAEAIDVAALPAPTGKDAGAEAEPENAVEPAKSAAA